MTEEEKLKKAGEKDPRIKKFIEDRALDRLNDLASATYMLIHIAMTFEAESEIILERYGLFIHDIKGRANTLNKAFDQYQYAMKQYYSDTMRKNFLCAFDSLLDDMYVYFDIPKKWVPGQKSEHISSGFQNALAKCIKEKGGKTYRYIERTPSGKVLMSTHLRGTAVRLPATWFKGIKKGEIVKVVIEPLAKF